ncbi:hypothetical protein [Sinorhizobium fredii]|uniref:hypothetical protein n=1 Tax=Rhizobium fredii TaxID=380 RepID=UPI003517F9A9
MSGRMFGSFWLEASVTKSGAKVVSVRQSDADIEHCVSVENCSGFPSDVTFVSEIPQQTSGMRFNGCGATWEETANRLSPREDRAICKQLEVNACRTGSETLHVRVRKYTDRHAGTTHEFSNGMDVVLTVTVN